jgi:pimeloyl-ACP methyl ester carboxylesterase
MTVVTAPHWPRSAITLAPLRGRTRRLNEGTLLSIYPGVYESEVVVAGESVRYVDSRSSKDDAAPLLLIHGSGGTAESHYGTLYPMFANRRRVIALDYGSDAADSTVPLTVDLLVQKVTAVLNASVRDAPVDVVGYSLGAAVALQLAADHPHRARTVTAIAGWLRTDEHQRLRNTIWCHLHETAADVLGHFSVLNAYGAPYLAKLGQREAAALVGRSRPGPDRRRQMELNASLDIVHTATRVQAPTLVIAAQHDQIAPVHHSWQMLGAVPDARLATVRAGHAVLTERPAEVYQLIDAFTQAPDAEPAGTTLDPIVV